MIDRLSIRNYKSIESVSFSPKKFNILIGRPNVGKSNLLEAISLLGINHLIEKGKTIEGIRFSSTGDLFHKRQKAIEIESNLMDLILERKKSGFYQVQHNIKEVKSLINPSNLKELTFDDSIFTLQDNGNIANNHDMSRHGFLNPVKLFLYKDNQTKSFENSVVDFLTSPYGQNLYDIIESNDEIHQELKEILEEYELKLVYLPDESVFRIQKESNSRISQIPYELLADTIQRYMFHYAAIKSNSEQILLFEEPESHSYPPYIHQLAQNIVASDNQYFIATHSPYLYDVMVKECEPKDLCILYVNYKIHQTTIQVVNIDMISTLKENDGDIFFNIERMVEEL